MILINAKVVDGEFCLKKADIEIQDGRIVRVGGKGATRFLCRGNDIRQALARVFAPVGATTNLGRAANRAGAI